MARVQKITGKVMWAGLMLAVQAAVVWAEEPKVEVSAELGRVALFKNGLGFFVASVTAPENRANFTIGPLAAATHGTFWVSYPETVPMQSLAAREVEREEAVEAATMAELLRGNVGRQVRLWVSGREETVVEGVIEYVAGNREPAAAELYTPGWSVEPRRNYGGGGGVQANLLMVRTGQGLAAIVPTSVVRAEILDGQAGRTFLEKKKAVDLEVRLKAPAAGEKLTVSYLAKGITWAPSYMVDITDGRTARIAAKAEIVNEVCDLEGVEVSLITGYPNLQFSDIVSPLARKENLAQFLQSLGRGQSGRNDVGVLSNVMRQSVAYGAGEDMGIMPSYATAGEGVVAEDLFYYPVEKVYLRKGEVGYYPLFSEAVPYRHIYQWKIADYIDDLEYYRRNRREPDQQPEEEAVWHCLRLENRMNLPWTTAPAEIVKEGNILGQDTLTYTPSKGESTLRITRAVSVKAEQVEYETDRKRDALRLYGSSYDLVTVKGEMSVRNFQEKAITLEIEKILTGEVKNSEPEAKVAKLARGLRRANPRNQLTWTIELEPGQQKEMSYIYQVYIPS